uniref:Palmitoyltransferase n=1 Tax=Heterorhabditis bacteriophora TaxID=37862 RepID=A0A1I7XFX2_HETBA
MSQAAASTVDLVREARGMGNGSMPSLAPNAPTRKWRLHTGRNRFFCDGRIMMARQSSVFLFTLFLISTTVTLFFIFDCPYLYSEVSPALPITAVLLTTLVFVNLFKTSFSDPGILPRATNLEVIETERQYQAEFYENSAYKPDVAGARGPPRTKEALLFLHHVAYSPHISDLWELSDTSHTVYVLYVISRHQQFLNAIRESPISLVVSLVCFFSVWLVYKYIELNTYFKISYCYTKYTIERV